MSPTIDGVNNLSTVSNPDSSQFEDNFVAVASPAPADPAVMQHFMNQQPASAKDKSAPKQETVTIDIA